MSAAPTYYALTPTTPPPSSEFDRASIISDYDSTHSTYSYHIDSYPYTHRLPKLTHPTFPVTRLEGKAKVKRQRLSKDMEGSTGKMNMHMAAAGSIASQPGYATPLAQYTAQMVVWLWFGNHAPPPPSSPTSRTHLDPFTSQAPLNPLQVQPTPFFTNFVSRILQITMVSHSVTLIALLYIYRLKMKNKIVAGAGSEQRPFVASLMLGNKYLDDNTYTNATWAELAGLHVSDINTMEKEFLQGMDWNLCVPLNEYQHWRNLLDGFMLARQREANYRRFYTPTYSPVLLTTPSQAYLPTMPVDSFYTTIRGHSASPPALSPPYNQAYTSPVGLQRKRSAYDAFAAEGGSTYVIPPEPATKILHIDQPRQSNSISHRVQPHASSSTSVSNPSLGRSSSLSRQIARLPTEAMMGRRGSAGHIHGLPHHALNQGYEGDLRHAATNHAASMQIRGRGVEGEGMYGGVQWGPNSTLAAPFDGSSLPATVPPEHLLFYTAAAEAHPGMDGSSRKAILRYQDPHPYSYPPSQPYTQTTQPYTQTQPFDSYNPNLNPPIPTQNVNYAYSPYTLPPPIGHTPSYPVHQAQLPPLHTHEPEVEPEPAQFANAGPPGWAYDPTLVNPGVGYGHATRWSVGSEERVGGSGVGSGEVDAWRPRSEWSSPMPGAFDPATWNRQ